ncbi:MAG: DUF4291 domain-containing protein [Myxococcales bacterium]|nr:DUF4291 domain-containing protein [Myxococcales bacterium]
MKLITEGYLSQRERWPAEGRHILAQHDDEGVVVYQAYDPAIGRFAVEHGYFGGPWKPERMTWIKPNFLWMMFRCGWGTKAQQEMVLAVRLQREAFEAILAEAVPSTFDGRRYATRADWQGAVKGSSVRLQWDPDHSPTGAKVERRAIQLGLRGATTRRYAREWILGIEDVTHFVREQRPHATPSRYERLLLPREEVFRPRDPAVAERLGLAGG